MVKTRAIPIIFLIAAVFCQITVAPHIAGFLGVWLEWINFCALATVIIAFFERKSGRLGWAAAGVSGLFLDLYSQKFFGFWIIVLAIIVALIKFVFKKYVRVPSFW